MLSISALNFWNESVNIHCQDHPSSQCHCAMALVVFCLAPNFRAYIECPVTKSLETPNWHWLISSPMGALVHCIAMTKLLAITVQNYTKIIISSLSDCTSPCLVLTKSPQISVQNKLLACSLEVIIEMTSSFLKNRDFCFGGKFKLVKNFELCPMLI